jgi:hypothetical protein
MSYSPHTRQLISTLNSTNALMLVYLGVVIYAGGKTLKDALTEQLTGITWIAP